VLLILTDVISKAILGHSFHTTDVNDERFATPGNLLFHRAEVKCLHLYRSFVSGRGEEAVSPVVGVMLMLVVTIIIAAVVSGFSGSLMGGTSQKAPTLSMDIKIANTGSWVGSGFFATVTGVSDALPTRDLKLVTSWKKQDSDGNIIQGGNTTAGMLNWAYANGTPMSTINPPYGSGPGVTGDQVLIPPYTPAQQFGNYTLMQGTGMSAVPDGVDTSDTNAVDGVAGNSAGSGYGITSTTQYKYTGMNGGSDPASLVLGGGWENLRAGDVVTVNVIYVPSGKVILSKNVMVTG